jgi:hypothetical protein
VLYGAECDTCDAAPRHATHNDEECAEEEYSDNAATAETYGAKLANHSLTLQDDDE